MKIDSRQLVEVIGLTAVVASLIFVGMQLRLDRRVAMGEQYFNRAEAFREDTRTHMQNDLYFEIQENEWNRGEIPGWWDEGSETARLLGNGDISIRQIYYRVLAARIEVTAQDNLLYQYQLGLIDDSFWEGQRSRIKNILRNNEVYRMIFRSTTRPYREVVDELILELKNEGFLDGT